MQRDTEIGGPGGAFPSTLWTVVEEAQQLSEAEARERVGRIISTYWKPVYVAIRAGWGKSGEDAKDLTQAFFTWFLDGDIVRKVQRGRGKFRGFLRAAVRNFVANRHRAEHQIKRGGDAKIVLFDFGDAALDAALPAAADRSPEQIFDSEWARTLLEEAIAAFEKKADPVTADVFRRYEDRPDGEEGPVYEAVAAELGITRDAVKHHLLKAREEIRAMIVERIREYALDDAEIQQELDLLRSAWS